MQILTFIANSFVVSELQKKLEDGMSNEFVVLRSVLC